MIWFTVLYIVGALLLIVALLGFRITGWHRQESDYWYRIALLVTLDPKLDDRWRPILVWTQANRPGLLARARVWQDPETRMRSGD